MATATTDRPRKRGGRPAGAKRTVGLKIQLTNKELADIKRAAAAESLPYSIFARYAVMAAVRQVLAENA